MLLLSQALAICEQAFDWPAALSSLAAKGGELALAPGTYRLPGQGLLLEGLKNVTIDGHGATLLATNRNAPAIRIENCQSARLKNFVLDYDPLPFTQGDITAVDPDAGHIDVLLHDGYPGMEVATRGNSAFTDARLQLFDKRTPTLTPGAPDYGIFRLERTGARTVRVYFQKWQPGLDKIATGNRVTISCRASEGITIHNSGGVELDNVTINTAPNAAILVRSCSDGGTFNNVRIVPGPKPDGASQPRLMSSCADGLNVCDARTGPVIEHCEFASQGDDGINLHGSMAPVLSWIDDRTFLSAMPWKHNRLDTVFRDGDGVTFVLPPGYQVTGAGHALSIRSTNEDAATWMPQLRKLWPVLAIDPRNVTFYEVTLDKRPKGAESGDWCVFPAMACPGFIIRDCYFHDHRGRGLRLMASDGKVENNRFEREKGAAISLGPEFCMWREAGWVSRVEVSHNQIRDVCQGFETARPDSFTTGAISVMAHTDAAGATSFEGNSDIEITANVIDGSGVGGISISNACGVQVSGNTISQTCLAHVPDAGSRNGLASQKPISAVRAQATFFSNTAQ